MRRWQWLVARTWQDINLSFPTLLFCIMPCWDDREEADCSTHHSWGARGHSLPVPRCQPGTFPPVPAAEDGGWLPGSWERSSCPLLYLLHLTNLMTGGMRSISNMASLAGSGQSTQEPFLHTPIPAGSRSLLPRASRCCLPLLAAIGTEPILPVWGTREFRWPSAGVEFLSDLGASLGVCAEDWGVPSVPTLGRCPTLPQWTQSPPGPGVDPWHM